MVTATPGGSAGVAQRFALGVGGYLSGSDVIELNDGDLVATSLDMFQNTGSDRVTRAYWWFFPEQREVTGLAIQDDSTFRNLAGALVAVEGSNDTTNGVDGTWEVTSIIGTAYSNRSLDGWRRSIWSISFTGGKRTVRIGLSAQSAGELSPRLIHWYGEKAAGETPDDIIFIDHDTTPGAEYAAPEDFGDRPLGTSVVRQFRVKNVSPTLTANSINIQCNDSDFAISTDGVTWVVTINIASLAAGAESATLYIRNTTPDPGALLGPRFARIVATVSSWT